MEKESTDINNQKQYKAIQYERGKNMTIAQTRAYLGYVRLTTNTGNSWVTPYNADNVTREEVASYFMGATFNIGQDENKETVTKVEFLD